MLFHLPAFSLLSFSLVFFYAYASFCFVLFKTPFLRVQFSRTGQKIVIYKSLPSDCSTSEATEGEIQLRLKLVHLSACAGFIRTNLWGWKHTSRRSEFHSYVHIIPVKTFGWEHRKFTTYASGSVYQAFHMLQSLCCVSLVVKRAAQVLDAALGRGVFTENLPKVCLAVRVVACQNAGARADACGAVPWRPRLIEHHWLVSNELLTSECSTLGPEAVGKQMTLWL